jgi:DNA-directed RNA polymerase subunit RPC12/RpoP
MIRLITGKPKALDKTGMMESKIHKALRFPYMISVPDVDESQWTTWMIKTPEDEAELDKYFPEFFEDKPKIVRKYKDKPKDVKMVADYFKEVKIEDPEGSAELFYAHYESVGWFRGKSKIKNWKMCLKNWDFNKKSDAEQKVRPQMYKLECLECGFESETDRKDTRMVCRRCKHRPLMTITNFIK